MWIHLQSEVLGTIGGIGFLNPAVDFVPNQRMSGFPDTHVISTAGLMTYLAHIPSTNASKWKDLSMTWVNESLRMARKATEDAAYVVHYILCGFRPGRY